MKRTLLLTICALMIASAAMADHIAIYGDASGSTCNLAPGFSTTATVIEKFSTGTTGSRWRVDTSLCPGSTVFALQTPWVTVGIVTSDISIAFGSCQTGSVVLGTLVANWLPGAVSIVPAENFANIIYTNCVFAELPATGGHASIGGDGHGCDYDAVQAKTWGSVKALYR